MSEFDSVTVSTVVRVPPDEAFAIFTEAIGTWWRPKVRHLFRPDRDGTMKFEPGPRGRLLETYPDREEPFEVGRVLVWNPPSRLVFEWRQGTSGAGEITEVEVRFEPEGTATRVTLCHRGWDVLSPEHPARDIYTGGAFTSMIGLRWADLLTGFRAHAGAATATHAPGPG